MDPSILGFPPELLRFNTELCFAMEVPADAAVRLAPEEHSEFKWTSLDEAEALMRWEGSKAALALLRRRLGA
jgi:lipoyl(octanoyl) transferase